MRLTVDDLNKIIRLTGAEDSSGLRNALTNHLISIYERGYDQALKDREYVEREIADNKCPYTFAHTKHWCRYDGCRDS